MKKYIGKYRILAVYTPYKNKKYTNIKKLYDDNLYEFHKRSIKFYTAKSDTFFVNLIDFDGKIKFKNPTLKQILKLKSGKGNLSLYADYDPKNSIKGLGFKDKEKALFTIKKIKNKSIPYQKRVLNTMIGRAKNHPHKNSDMEEAISIFKKYLFLLK